MYEKKNAEKVLTAIRGLEKAMGNMTMTLLGNADECPEEYMWYDEILGDTDDALCKLKSVMMEKYNINPDSLLMMALDI